MIATPAGDQPIERLKPGDAIWTFSPDGSRVEGVVTARVVGSSGAWIELRTDDGRVLRTTGAHPIATDKGFAPMSTLVEGRKVLVPGGEAVIKSIENLREPVRVFDLCVSPFPVFAAGGVLVHNKTVPSYPTPDAILGAWVGDVPGFGLVYLSLDHGDPDPTGYRYFARGYAAILDAAEARVLRGGHSKPARDDFQSRLSFHGDAPMDGFWVEVDSFAPTGADLAHSMTGRVSWSVPARDPRDYKTIEVKAVVFPRPDQLSGSISAGARAIDDAKRADEAAREPQSTD